MFSGIAPRSPEPAPTDLGRSGLHRRAGPLPQRARGSRHPGRDRVRGPYTQPADTAAERLKLPPEDLAVEMLNRRLSILSKKENAPFIRADTRRRRGLQPLPRVRDRGDTARPTSGSGGARRRRPGAAPRAQFGFRPDELREAVADYRNDLEQAVKTASTRRSDDLAGEIADSLVDREVFTSPGRRPRAPRARRWTR
jgi:hypothetical protein